MSFELDKLDLFSAGLKKFWIFLFKYEMMFEKNYFEDENIFFKKKKSL